MKLSLEELQTVRDALCSLPPETGEEDLRLYMLLLRVDRTLHKVKAAALAGGNPPAKAAPETPEGG